MHFLQGSEIVKLNITDLNKLRLIMLKSARVFQVLIDLIQNDLWCVVVLHGGTTYLGVLVLLLDDLVYLVVFLSGRYDESIKP